MSMSTAIPPYTIASWTPLSLAVGDIAITGRSAPGNRVAREPSRCAWVLSGPSFTEWSGGALVGAAVEHGGGRGAQGHTACRARPGGARLCTAASTHSEPCCVRSARESTFERSSGAPVPSQERRSALPAFRAPVCALTRLVQVALRAPQSIVSARERISPESGALVSVVRGTGRRVGALKGAHERTSCLASAGGVFSRAYVLRLGGPLDAAAYGPRAREHPSGEAGRS